MKKSSALFIALACWSNLHSQEWEISPDSSRQGLTGIEAFNGTYVITGTDFAAYHGGQTWILDTAGTVLNRIDKGGGCILQTPDSGFVISNEESNSGALMKLNASLEIEWTRYYKTTSYQQGFGSIALTSDNGIIA